MADFTFTPNMSLPNPTVGAAAGPKYAQYVDACFTILDQHSHAPGSGVQINPDGIDINADLSFNSNNAVMLRSTRYAPQTSPIASMAPDQGCLYVATVSSNNELFYNDSSGNQVQITSGGSISVTAGNNISNGTVKAQVNNSGLNVFEVSTSDPANVIAGSYVMGATSNGSNTLTIQPPTLGAGETLTLPPYPGSNSFVTMTTSGVLAGSVSESGGITGSNIGTNTITGGSSGNLALTTVTAANIANQTITATQIANSTITGTQLENSISLPGNPGVGGVGQVATGPNTGAAPYIQWAIVSTSSTIIDGSGSITVSSGWSGSKITLSFPNPTSHSPTVVVTAQSTIGNYVYIYTIPSTTSVVIAAESVASTIFHVMILTTGQ